MQYIKIHALDNVAVALADLAEGTEVSVDNQTVTLRQDVARDVYKRQPRTRPAIVC